MGGARRGEGGSAPKAGRDEPGRLERGGVFFNLSERTFSNIALSKRPFCALGPTFQLIHFPGHILAVHCHI